MNEQSPHTDIVNDWIIGYLTNSLTPEEMQSLQNWLNVSEENRKYFSDMQEVWIAASDEADEQHFDKERAYQLFLEHTENLVQPSVKRKTLTISPWMYAAAMVVIVFFCGTIAFQSGKRVLRNQLTQITVEAPYGSKTKARCPGPRAGRRGGHPPRLAHVRAARLRGALGGQQTAVLRAAGLRARLLGAERRGCIPIQVRQPLCPRIGGRHRVGRPRAGYRLAPGTGGCRPLAQGQLPPAAGRGRGTVRL